MSSQIMPNTPAQTIQGLDCEQWLRKQTGQPILPEQVVFRFPKPTKQPCGCTDTTFHCTYTPEGFLDHKTCGKPMYHRVRQRLPDKWPCGCTVGARFNENGVTIHSKCGQPARVWCSARITVQHKEEDGREIQITIYTLDCGCTERLIRVRDNPQSKWLRGRCRHLCPLPGDL